MDVDIGSTKSVDVCDQKCGSSPRQYCLKSKKQIMVTTLSNFLLLPFYKPFCLISSGGMTSVIKNRAFTTNFQGNQNAGIL